MKLELKHLAPYLPYGFMVTNEIEVAVITVRNLDMMLLPSQDFKPILRPLSDLNKEMFFTQEGGNEYKSYPMQEFYIMYGGGSGNKKRFESDYYDNIIYTPYKSLSYETVNKLLEWHFDVFGLIPKGLAIDINTI